MVDTSPDAPVQTSPIELYRHAKVGNCQFWLHETVTEEDALKKLTHMITEENFWCIADGRAARRERNINEVYGSLK